MEEEEESLKPLMEAARALILDTKNLVNLVNEEHFEEEVQMGSIQAESHAKSLIQVVEDLIGSVPSAAKGDKDFLQDASKSVRASVHVLTKAAKVRD